MPPEEPRPIDHSGFSEEPYKLILHASLKIETTRFLIQFSMGLDGKKVKGVESITVGHDGKIKRIEVKRLNEEL